MLLNFEILYYVRSIINGVKCIMVWKRIIYFLLWKFEVLNWFSMSFILKISIEYFSYVRLRCGFEL